MWSFRAKQPNQAEEQLKNMSDGSQRSQDRTPLAFEESAPEKATLQYHAFNYIPTRTNLDDFESLPWRQRQLALARLRRLESEVNLKPLPAVVPLIVIVSSIGGVSLSLVQKDTGLYYSILAGFAIFVLIAALVILYGIKHHTSKEACLTAWTEAFKDSHALRTKIEEEDRKANKDSETAASVKDDSPAVKRYRWAEKIFG